MASADHLALSDFIKSVHQDLRETSRKIGPEQAWQKHCSDEENLKRYSDAMQRLACQYWEPNIASRADSRIQWAVNTCVTYFADDIHRFRSKESDICLKINSTFDSTDLCDHNGIDKLKLLDVGSCYNPFNKFEMFEVTAIDIAPAKEDVVKCDFLSVTVGDAFILNVDELFEMPKCHFNIVVFSLLLEYLPSPKQRLECCRKAYDLLEKEGLLVIITPDSNHVGVNAKYMKSWRYILARNGFLRTKYEKLPHIHCMAFRKSASKLVASRWAELREKEQLYQEMYIPQDLNKPSEEHVNTNEKTVCETDQNRDFSELPQCDIFE